MLLLENIAEIEKKNENRKWMFLEPQMEIQKTKTGRLLSSHVRVK